MSVNEFNKTNITFIFCLISGLLYRHYTKCHQKHESTIIIRKDHHTIGYPIMRIILNRIVHVSMSGMLWIRWRAEGHHHQTQSEISKCRLFCI